MSKNFYITTPIYYPNANPHLGHAYTTTVCDIIARYHRLCGDEVYLLTGVDENSEKIIRAAKAAGQSHTEYRDSFVLKFKHLFGELQISYDQFIRTSDTEVHFPGAQEMWRRLVSAGDIEKRAYKGLYCVGHEAFITEKELVNGKCPDHNETPQILEEENYFFRLSKYTDAIREKIVSGEFDIVPETRKNEILALLDRGLEDVSFSRPSEKVAVGVSVPDDPTQKIYVWCDALVNYISALGFGRSDDTLYRKFWPADVHVIGKDILRFHAAIWPAMLLSAKLPLPKKILVHGFITSGGKKMSKSLGNVIDPKELIAEYGGEAVRFFLARHISPFEDGDVTLESFKGAYNADLANGLGNLAARLLQMLSTNVHKAIDIPDFSILANLTATGKSFLKHLESFELNRAMFVLWSWISDLDTLIQEQKPFEVAKTNKIAAEKQLTHMLRQLAEISFLLQPIMPETSKKILTAIKLNKKPENLFPRK